MAIKSILNKFCSNKAVPRNEFISIEEAYNRQRNRIDPQNPVAGFTINLEDLKHFVQKIDDFNTANSDEIKGVRIWKGIQIIDDTCIEDLLFEPVNEDNNDIHFDKDEPKAANGKTLIMASARPCPHLCGGPGGTNFFFTNIGDTIHDPYEGCSKSNCNPYE